MSNTFGFVRLLAGLWLLTCCWQWACDGLPHRAISMKWNELGRCQVPRARREPAGIHVMPRCTSPGPSSQAMLCNPSLNYLSQCIERAVERLVLPPHLLFFFFFFFLPSCFFKLSLACHEPTRLPFAQMAIVDLHWHRPSSLLNYWMSGFYFDLLNTCKNTLSVCVH